MGTQSEYSSPSATLHPHNNASVTTTNLASQAPQIKLEKTLEEATETGVLRLNGRKLKEISLKLQSLPKYDITDTIIADLSKNRLNELPQFICELYQLTELSLYSNLLRALPCDESLLSLQHLTYLNLSKNQISVIPQALCYLPKLQVLIVSHNRLCSLPEELGRMSSLYDLDVSCNEISFLPAQIVNLGALKYLDLRRNLLVELPADLNRLTSLTRLDISENRIQCLPSDVRKMSRLTEFLCNHNPLITPPAALCTRGLNHVKKFLENEERKRGGSAGGGMDTGTLTQTGHRGLRSRESFQLTLRNPVSKASRESGYPASEGTGSFSEKRFSGAACKDDVDAGDEIRRFAAQRMEFTRSPKKPAQPLPPQRYPHPQFGLSTQTSSSFHDLCAVSPSSEATTLQASGGGQTTPSTLSPTSEFKPIQLGAESSMLKVGDVTSADIPPGSLRSLTPEEEFRQRREAIVAKQRAEVKRAQKEAVIAFVKQRQSPLLGSAQPLPHPQQPPPPPPLLSLQHQQQPVSPTSESTPPLPNFTMRRGLDRAREEQELLSRMRAIIEARLKMTLPENLAGALTDGVVLCHLANNVRPRSVATIHVPSAANPKLTMAKCRRNVDNFLDACRRLGVPPELTCSAVDILEEERGGICPVAITVIELAKLSTTLRPHSVSTLGGIPPLPPGQLDPAGPSDLGLHRVGHRFGEHARPASLSGLPKHGAPLLAGPSGGIPSSSFGIGPAGLASVNPVLQDCPKAPPPPRKQRAYQPPQPPKPL